jgi:hypothetical protein
LRKKKKETDGMTNAKEELKRDIEQARERLDSSIERRENYDAIYQNSVELDRLIELYIASDF